MGQALIALGANLRSSIGGPLETLRAAVETLAQKGCTNIRQSRYYETLCFPPGAGPDYVNAALACDWNGSAQGLLNVLHEIEADYGRVRETRWAGRVLDLDLLAFDSQVLPDVGTYHHWRTLDPKRQSKEPPDQMILPHPRLQDRGFVLVPLHDVAPDWVHPVLGISVAKMLKQCDQYGVRIL